MLHRIQQFVKFTDATIASAYLSLRRERNGLLVFLFHSIFRDQSDVSQNVVDPLERTTLDSLRTLIQYYRLEGYRFVSQADLLDGLDASRRCAMLTFDDGYANNALSLPLLEELKIPATFFISTAHVRDQKSYWWDVLYRERTERKTSVQDIYREAVSVKGMRTEQIEHHLLGLFGPRCLRPRGEIDRPFTADELRKFAKHPMVTIGNHTENHAILTNYSTAEAAAQIHNAQTWLTETLGNAPLAIAYPNGAHDDTIIASCRDAGLKLGFTVRPQKNRLPLDTSDGAFRIARFCPNGYAPIEPQCRAYRSDLQVYSACRDAYLKYARGQVAQ